MGRHLAEREEFSVRFWGVRGSIACPGPRYQKYGGNTSCLEVRCGEQLLIFDAGTGLLRLGEELAAADQLNCNLFLTHTHFDHINGLPFFGPMFNPRNRMRLWAGHLFPDMSLHDALVQFMAAPLFPVPPKVFAASVSFHDFQAGETIELTPEVRLRTAALNHPNRATGYRVEYAGRSICYVTDTEHVPGEPDGNVLALIDRADLVIYDCTYTDQEFPSHVSWGHSTWQEGLRLCDMAEAKRLAIFHHDPGHDDAFMDDIASRAENARAGTVVAREGLVLTP